MTDAFSLDGATLAAIVAMSVMTYLTRVGGFVIVRFLRLGARARYALAAVPPAVLMAVIAPTVFAKGPAEALAAGITALAATRLPMLGTILVGTAAVVGLRLVIG